MIRSAIWQTIGILLLAAMALPLPFDPHPQFWAGAMMGCGLSAVLAIWIDVWRRWRNDPWSAY